MAAGIEPAGGSGPGSLGKGCVGVVDAGVHRGGRDGDGNAACRCSRWGEGVVAAVAGAALQDQIAAGDQVAVAAGSLHGIGHPAGALAAGTGCAHPQTDRCGHGDRHRQQAGEALLRCLDRDVGVGTGGVQLGVAYPGGQGRAGNRKVGGRGHTEAVFSPGGPHAHGHGTDPPGHRAGHGHHLGVHRLIVAGVDHDVARGLQGHIGHFGDQITGEGVDRIGTATGQGHPGADAPSHTHGHRSGTAAGGDGDIFAGKAGLDGFHAQALCGRAVDNVAQVGLHVFFQPVLAEADADAYRHTRGDHAGAHTHRHGTAEGIAVDQGLLASADGEGTHRQLFGGAAARAVPIDAGPLVDEHPIGGFAAGPRQANTNANTQTDSRAHPNRGGHRQHHRADARFVTGLHREGTGQGDGAVADRGLDPVGVGSRHTDGVTRQGHTNGCGSAHAGADACADAHAHGSRQGSDAGGDGVAVRGLHLHGAALRHGGPVQGGCGAAADGVGGFGPTAREPQANTHSGSRSHTHPNGHGRGCGGGVDGCCRRGGHGDGSSALERAEIAHVGGQLPIQAVAGQGPPNSHGKADVGLPPKRHADTQRGTDGRGQDVAGVGSGNAEGSAAQGSPAG